MKWYCFQQIWEFIRYMWAIPEKKEEDDWWMIDLAINKFNKNCHH